MARLILLSILGLLLIVFSAMAVLAGCENDLAFGCNLDDPSQAFIAEPLDFSKPFKMNKVMGVYVIDRGVNFFIDDFGHYELSEVRMQQISCSPGLTGGAYFGDGKPGCLDLTSANPHRHLNWGVSSPGTYFFEFELTNARDVNDNPLKDSPVFLMVFIAECDYAQVDIKTAHRMPDSSLVEIANLVVNTSGDFDGAIYAQVAGRYAGLRLISNSIFASGTTFTAKGALGRDGGERTLLIHDVLSTLPGNAPKPLFMLTKCLGGPGEVINTPSSVGCIGLRTTGLLVKVCGAIHYNDSGEAFVDDGARIQNDPEVKGCRISLEGLTTSITLPSQGFLSITGISGVDANLQPIIRPRSQSDIKTY